MALQPNQQPSGWRARVQVWLRDVQQHAQIYRLDLQTAATNNQRAFPRNPMLTLVKQVIPLIAKWLIKSALRDAARQLGLELSDEAIDVMATVILAAI